MLSFSFPSTLGLLIGNHMVKLSPEFIYKLEAKPPSEEEKAHQNQALQPLGTIKDGVNFLHCSLPNAVV